MAFSSHRFSTNEAHLRYPATQTDNSQFFHLFFSVYWTNLCKQMNIMLSWWNLITKHCAFLCSKRHLIEMLGWLLAIKCVSKTKTNLTILKKKQDKVEQLHACKYVEALFVSLCVLTCDCDIMTGRHPCHVRGSNKTSHLTLGTWCMASWHWHSTLIQQVQEM